MGRGLQYAATHNSAMNPTWKVLVHRWKEILVIAARKPHRRWTKLSSSKEGNTCCHWKETLIVIADAALSQTLLCC